MLLTSVLGATTVGLSVAAALPVLSPTTTFALVTQEPSHHTTLSTDLNVSRKQRSLDSLVKRKHLYGKLGYNLQILPNGTVRSSRVDSKFSVLQFITLALTTMVPGLLAFKGVESGRYLCINETGVVYSSLKLTEECKFLDTLLPNSYNTYKSYKYPKKGKRQWFLSINKRGKVKTVKSRRKIQESSQFLPRPLDKARLIQIMSPMLNFNNLFLTPETNSAIIKAISTPPPSLSPSEETTDSDKKKKKHSRRKCKGKRKNSKKCKSKSKSKRNRKKNSNSRKRRPSNGKDRPKDLKHTRRPRRRKITTTGAPSS